MTVETAQTMAPTRITAEELIERMGRGEQFTILDNRNPKAWSEAETKLPGALRITAGDLDENRDRISGGRTIITYCT